MFSYLKNFAKDSKNEIKTFRDIGIPIFVYQTIVRIILFFIFGIFYNASVSWILKNPGKDYIFITGLNSLDYIHIDKLIIFLIFLILLFLFSFFIETFGVMSIARQYYLGKRVKLKTTFFEIFKYFRINFKVQILKYVFIIFNFLVLFFLIYTIYKFFPNNFGILLSIILILKNLFLITKKIIEYKDVGQKVFENKKNIFEIYDYKISKERKNRILKFYVFKIFLIIFISFTFPILWLYLTWIICKLVVSHEIITYILLGLNSSISIILVMFFSYIYVSFFTLRATRKYLEETKEKSKFFYRYKKRNKLPYKKIAFFAFIILIATESFFHFIYFKENILKEKSIKIFAHRSGMIEKQTNNSIKALNYSIKNNVEYVEIDVQMSKEGIPIVFHNSTYFDGKQQKYINNTSLSEIKKYNLRTGENDNKLDAERIPTLKEFLEGAKGKIKVNIEIKTTKNYEIELTEKVIKIIKDIKIQKDIIITSFDYKVLKKAKKILPNIKVGLIITAYIGNIEDIGNMDVDWLMINDYYYYLYKGTFNSFGKKIGLWSFSKSFNGIESLYEDINGVIVNDPIEIKKEIKYYKNLSTGEKFYYHIKNRFLFES